MRRILLFFIALFICYNTNAQLFKSYNEGYYYNTSDQKISGLISSQPSKDCIYFKPNKDARSEKITIKDIKALVILTGRSKDSLNVLTEDNNENKRYFATFFTSTPYMRFYNKIVVANFGGTPTMSIRPASSNANGTTIAWTTSRSYSENVQIIMYRDGSTTYELTKKNYIDVLSKAFADDPDFVQKLQHKKIKFNNPYQIFEEYKHARIKNQNIPVTIKLDSAG
jgi:hypothetical protein